jgi:hypothetical protein
MGHIGTLYETIVRIPVRRIPRCSPSGGWRVRNFDETVSGVSHPPTHTHSAVSRQKSKSACVRERAALALAKGSEVK